MGTYHVVMFFCLLFVTHVRPYEMNVQIAIASMLIACLSPTGSSHVRHGAVQPPASEACRLSAARVLEGPGRRSHLPQEQGDRYVGASGVQGAHRGEYAPVPVSCFASV